MTRRLEIALINVSILLITNVNANIKTTLDKYFPPCPSNNEKIIVLGSSTDPKEIATIPQNPKINMTGKIIKKEFLNPAFKSSVEFAAKILCQIPWSNKFVENTAIKKVKPAVYP